jgi:flagellin-like protein
MVGFTPDERGSSSVTGLVLLVAVTILLSSAVAVFAFGVDTNDVENAIEDILDMNDNMNALVPWVVVPAAGVGPGRESDGKPADHSTRSRPPGRT